MTHVDVNSGSILTFALKYSQEFANKLSLNDMIKDNLYELVGKKYEWIRDYLYQYNFY